MKRVWVFLVVMFAISLSACEQNQVEPQDYDQSLFDVYYETKDYKIMRRINIEDQFFTSIGYDIGDGYMLGQYHRSNFYVQVGEDMYYLDDGVKMELYNGQDLVNIGLPGVSVRCEKEE